MPDTFLQSLSCPLPEDIAHLKGAGEYELALRLIDRRLAGRAAGILVLVGVVNLPIIHYSVYWWNTLHQGSTNLQQTIDPSMRLPLRICIFAFLALSVTLTLMRLRNLILQLERRRPWVVALANKGAVR